ncbi:MAG: hypothetical protein SFW08_13020 [Gemmatimonadaceae bacterium]|nr:hypothetical protein [Gemmatimonadaceae bacterium]
MMHRTQSSVWHRLWAWLRGKRQRVAVTTGEIVLRTLRLQQSADEWRRRPSRG